MADNVSITDSSGSAAVIATDQVVDLDLGTVEVQYTKLMDGTLNGTAKAVVGPHGLEAQDRLTSQVLEDMLTELKEIKWLLMDLVN